MTKATAFQKRLAARDADLLQLSAKHVALPDDSAPVKLQDSDKGTVSHDPKSVSRACGRSAKRTKVTSRCKSSSGTPYIAAFLALLGERDDFKNFCEALTLKN